MLRPVLVLRSDSRLLRILTQSHYWGTLSYGSLPILVYSCSAAAEVHDVEGNTRAGTDMNLAYWGSARRTAESSDSVLQACTFRVGRPTSQSDLWSSRHVV